MRKMNKFFKIEIIACLFLYLFVSCSGLSVEEKTNKKFTVSGKVLSESSSTNSVSSRTVTAVFDVLSTDVWSITATNNEKTVDGIVVDGSYEIELSQGTWTIEVFLKNEEEQVLLYGSEEVTVYDSTESITQDITVSIKNEGTGSVKLSFKDETGTVKSLICKSAEFGVKTASFSSNLAELNIDSLTPNSYDVIFYFDDSEGNSLYSCREVINVFPNRQTNTWKGSSPWLRTQNGVTNFVLTQDLINSFDVQLVSNSKTVLYGNFRTSESEEYLFDYYFTDDVKASLPQSIETQMLQSGKPNYCFDSKGNTYYFDYYNANNTLKSTKVGFEVTTSGSPSFSNYMSIDKKTDILYTAYVDDSNKKQVTIYKWPKLISEQSDADITSYTLTGFQKDLPTFCPFAIYDEVVYIAYLYYSNNVYFASVDISNVEDGGEIAISPTLITIEGNLWFQPAVRDIIYQDSCVYFLFDNSYLTSDSLVASSGALVKYDTFTGQFSTCGMISEYQVLKAKFFAKVYEGEEFRIIYEDQECTKIRFVEKKFPVPPVSETLSTKYFYGPQRFVGIKPKKLVISDEGVAFYTDADGSNYYKNVNRVVIVDLETFAMESSYEVDASFNDDVTLKPRTSFSTNDGANYYGSVYSVGPTVAGQSSFGIYVMGENGGESAKRVPYEGKIEFIRKD